jgi:hypothetical protein
MISCHLAKGSRAEQFTYLITTYLLYLPEQRATDLPSYYLSPVAFPSNGLLHSGIIFPPSEVSPPHSCPIIYSKSISSCGTPALLLGTPSAEFLPCPGVWAISLLLSCLFHSNNYSMFQNCKCIQRNFNDYRTWKSWGKPLSLQFKLQIELVAFLRVCHIY